MKKSLISSLIAVAIICSGSTLAFADQKSTPNNHQTSSVNNAKFDDATVEYNHNQLVYSIEEMKKAVNLLDNADLTNDNNYSRMIVFAKQSLDRVRSLNIYNNTENWAKYSWAKDVEKHLAWIEQSNNQISNTTYRINRIIQAMDNVRTVFEPSRQDTNTNKHNVINTLNKVLTEEVKAGIVNQTTLRNAVTFMHNYNGKIVENNVTSKNNNQVKTTSTKNSEVKNNQQKTSNAKIDDATVEYNHDQFMYSIEEMKKAVNLLDSADLTKDNNYEKMSVFAKQSVDRLRSLGVYKNTKVWSKNYSWAKDSSKHINWIENSNQQISNCINHVNRILQAMDNVETVFEPARQDTNTNKKNVINTLNKVLTEEVKAGVVNQTTLKSAESFMNNYNDKIVKTTASKKDNQVKTTSTKNSKVKNNQQKTSNAKIDDATVEYNHDQFMYSIEEMKKAVNLLDNADLTKDNNYEKMSVFAKQSVDRLRSLSIYKNTKVWTKNYSWAKDASNHIAWIENSNQQISNCIDRVNRVLQSMDNVETVFEPARQDTNTNKKNVINTLNKVLNEEVKAGVVNQTTLRNAISFMHNYNNKIVENNTTSKNNNQVKETSNKTTEVKNKENKTTKPAIDDATVEYNHNNLVASVEDMRQAIKLLDQKNLSKSDYEKMITYAKSSLDRVRNLDIYNNTKIWAKNYSWAKDAAKNIAWIEEAGNEIRNSINVMPNQVSNI